MVVMKHIYRIELLTKCNTTYIKLSTLVIKNESIIIHALIQTSFDEIKLYKIQFT